MKRSRLLIGIAIVCVAGIAVFQFVRDRGDKQPSDDTPSHEPRTHPQHKILQPTESPQPAGLHGTVIDAQGNPVCDVLIEAGVFEGDAPSHLIRKVCVQSTTTDSRGEFRFPAKAVFSLSEELQDWIKPSNERRPTSLYSLLIASKEGYVAERCPAEFESVTGPQKIVLRKAPEVSGLVVWEEIQQPIPEARVVVEQRFNLGISGFDLYQPHTVADRSDDEGRFSLAVPAEGEAGVYASVDADDNQYSTSYVALVPGEKITDLVLTVKLGSTTLIKGKVLDSEGNPVSGAEVRLSTDQRVGEPVKSHEDGTYQLIVSKEWPYQNYFLDNWPDKPKLSTIYHGHNLHVDAQGESRIEFPYGRWDWVIWTPPAHAPPERLVAFHPDFEIGVFELPSLGVGQVRQGVDIVLYKGTKVSGRVLDESSEPAQQAEIEMELDPKVSPVLIKNDNEFIQLRNWITPAEDGSFEIRFLREGSYQLTASQEDCDPETKRLELLPHQVVEGFDFVLVRKTGFIRGKVLDQNGNPWPHGIVKAGVGRAFDFFMSWLAKGYTAEIRKDGSYELSRLQTGKYNIWLDVSKDYPEPEGILQATSLRDVPTGTEGANITVTQLPAGMLRVRVMDQMQRPVERFHIVCSPLKLTYGKSGIVTGPMRELKVKDEYRRLHTYIRDAKYSGALSCRRDVVSELGEFVAERVAPGSYFVSVKSDKHGEKFAEVKIEAGGETEVTFELESLGSLEGRVVDSRGQPIEGIAVRATKTKEVPASTEYQDAWMWEYKYYVGSRVASGADGGFVLENLEQTRYRITAENRKERRSVYADVTIGPNGNKFLELVFENGSSAIEGYVYGKNGGPLSKTGVVLEGRALKTATSTDEGGHYRFTDLAPGKYLARAEVGGILSFHYRGRRVELAEGERASVDIVDWGDGGIEGSVSLAGDAAAAAAWYTSGRPWLEEYKTRLVLRELGSSETLGGQEMILPVASTFDLSNIPAGAYEIHAYSLIGVTPEPLLPGPDTAFRSCLVKFVSETKTIRVVSGSKASIHLTMSDAATPHYPIPDPGTCDIWVPAEQ
ncbi:MAG: carboxypeptidase regulatory-like domain-containing protein [bacterium]|nr:carboxypeptidase regulatory-like domain-containing protein [bacterium]